MVLLLIEIRQRLLWLAHNYAAGSLFGCCLMFEVCVLDRLKLLASLNGLFEKKGGRSSAARPSLRTCNLANRLSFTGVQSCNPFFIHKSKPNKRTKQLTFTHMQSCKPPFVYTHAILQYRRTTYYVLTTTYNYYVPLQLLRRLLRLLLPLLLQLLLLLLLLLRLPSFKLPPHC